MNFLAIDTSSGRLIVAAHKEGKTVVHDKECALRHSVLLFDEIDAVLKEAELPLAACDLIACVVGPGSFTGIRIGISAVKGLCLAAGLPALAVTSFDCLAYADRGEKKLALVDAGHGAFYACPYEDGKAGQAGYFTAEQIEDLKADASPVTDDTVDRSEGLVKAVLSLEKGAAPAGELAALYLRKSAAEEGR